MHPVFIALGIYFCLALLMVYVLMCGNNKFHRSGIRLPRSAWPTIRKSGMDSPVPVGSPLSSLGAVMPEVEPAAA